MQNPIQTTVSTIPNSGSLISEDVLSKFEELQIVANYRIVRKTLRSSGIGGIFFGAIAILMGFGGMGINPINVILGMIGMFLLVESIWIIIAPTPKGLFVDGIAFILVGSWNIFVMVINVANGTDILGFLAILAMFQIAWGGQKISRYKHFSKIPFIKPTAENLLQLDNIVKIINKAKAKKEPDLVEFHVKSFSSTQIWKGKLSQGYAIFVEKSGHDIMFVAKEDVGFVKQGKVLIGSTLKGTFHLSERKFDSRIAPIFIERIEAWKS